MDPYRHYEQPKQEGVASSLFNKFIYPAARLLSKCAFISIAILFILCLSPFLITLVINTVFWTFTNFWGEFFFNFLLASVFTYIPMYAGFNSQIKSIYWMLILWIREDPLPRTEDGQIDWMHFHKLAQQTPAK